MQNDVQDNESKQDGGFPLFQPFPEEVTNLRHKIMFCSYYPSTCAVSLHDFNVVII